MVNSSCRGDRGWLRFYCATLQALYRAADYRSRSFNRAAGSAPLAKIENKQKAITPSRNGLWPVRTFSLVFRRDYRRVTFPVINIILIASRVPVVVQRNDEACEALARFCYLIILLVSLWLSCGKEKIVRKTSGPTCSFHIHLNVSDLVVSIFKYQTLWINLLN